MKILITGGTGLIGTALRQSLQEKGHQVIIVSRNPQQRITGTKIIPWDLEILKSELGSTHAVVNLAGSSLAGKNPLTMRWTKSRKAEIITSRIQAGTTLNTALENTSPKPEVLIQASAIGYYGNQGKEQVDENSLAGNDFLAEVCQSWEKSTLGVEEQGIRRVIARIGLVLSREGGLLPLLSLPFQFFLGGKVGTGKQTMSWIHIADLVKSLEYFIENPTTQGVYNITAPCPVTNQEFGSQLSSTLNRPSWLPIPSFLLKIMFGEAATLALDGREVLPKRLTEAGYQHQYNQLSAALKALYTSRKS
jgi:uncharacterized protein